MVFVTPPALAARERLPFSLKCCILYVMIKVLVADSTEDGRTVLEHILRDGGYESVFVQSSEEIINSVYVEHPDIIIFDLKFSGPSGLEILQKLKSAPSTRDIPVMFIAPKNARASIKKGYGLGAYDYITRPYFSEEVIARIRNITYVLEKMKELEALLVRDYLTGLYNRKFFMERLQEEFAWSVIYKEPFSLMMFDIDHFKKTNDTYGHACGDEILRQVANVLISVLRPQDIVARYGGEEFIALLANTDTAYAAILGENLRAAVNEGDFSCSKGGARLHVSISIGISTFDGNMDISHDNFIGQADKALYEAKRTGRNKVVIYSEGLD